MVGDPAVPSPLNDKVARAVLISSWVPLKPTSVRELPEQLVGSEETVSYTTLTLPTIFCLYI